MNFLDDYERHVRKDMSLEHAEAMQLRAMVKLAQKEIDDGHAIKYLIERKKVSGHLAIYLETDQGWNPEPFWQNFDPGNVY